jgi:outer membrane protein assembly factor BamB
MKALALVLALGAAPAATSPGPGFGTHVPPAAVRLYGVAWQKSFVPPRVLEWRPAERGGVAVDPVTGLAIFGTRDGWLHAVRPDGSVAWDFRGDAPFGPPAIDGDTVYAGSIGGRLHAIAIATGKERWRYQAEEDLATRPAVAHGSVFVASLQDTVFCVDAATGAWRWHHRREARGPGLTIFGAASVVVDGESVYGAYSDGYVAALDPKNGAARWERRISPANQHTDVDALAIEGQRLYAAAYSGAVVALDARSGETLWSFQAPGAARLVIAGSLVVAVTSSSVHGLSRADGAPVWTTSLGGAPTGAPVLAGRWLLVPAGGGGLRWIEPTSGRTLRVFDPGTGVSGTPGVSGRRVYVLSNDGNLFALDLS